MKKRGLTNRGWIKLQCEKRICQPNRILFGNSEVQWQVAVANGDTK
jgi:hypothetical protein